MRYGEAKCIRHRDCLECEYPLCRFQYGQLLDRKTIADRWDDKQIHKVPPSNHFTDLVEAGIKLVYGAHLDYSVSKLQVKRLAKATHQIVLFRTPWSKRFLGAVIFGKLKDGFLPEALRNNKPSIADLTRCKVSVTVIGPRLLERYGDHGTMCFLK